MVSRRIGGPRRYGVLGIAAALCVCLVSGVAFAQSDVGMLRGQIDTLRNQIQTLTAQIADLERVVYGGAAPPRRVGGTSAGDAASDPTRQRLAVVESAVDELREWQRSVDGRFDEMNNTLARMNSRLDRLVADIDYRLAGLEQREPPPGESFGTEPAAGFDQPPPGIDDGQVGSGSGSVARDPGSGYEPSGAPRDLGTIPAQEDDAGALAEPPQTALTALPDGSAEEQYQYAFSLLRGARYDEAEAALASFVAAHPEHELAENASYWRGESFYARRMFGEAARVYAVNLQRYPEGAKAPDNLLKLALSLVNLERPAEACQAFTQLERAYPDMPSNIRQAAQRGRATAGCS